MAPPVLRHARDSARNARHRHRPSTLDDRARRVDQRRLPRRDRGVRRSQLAARHPRAAGGGPARRSLHDAVCGLRGDRGFGRGLRAGQPLHHRPDVSLLGHVLSGVSSTAAARMDCLRDAALAWGRALPHVHARRGERHVGTGTRRLSLALRRDRLQVGTAHVCAEAAEVTTAAFAGSRSRMLFERNLMVYRRSWMVIFSGVFEPLFYLFSMGIGLGHFVGEVPGPGGRLVEYSTFVAPALLASAAMNGAIYDATNVFWKLKYMKTYDAVLSTPIEPADVAVGETAWALFRGFLYAISFMAVAGALGLIESAWGLLALPGAVVIGFAFAGLGVAATTFMRTWQDFELIGLVQLPLFLFSATFFPITTYPNAIH